MAQQSPGGGGKKKKLIRSARNKLKGVYAAQRRRTTRNLLERSRQHAQRHPKDTFGVAKFKERLHAV